MRKYFQIGIVFVIFFGIVIVRTIFAKDDQKSPIIHSLTNSPSDTSSQKSSQSSQGGRTYTDGTYTGDVTDAVYGPMQVQAIIQNGKISDIQFLQYPNDNPTTLSINQQAMPILKSEAIQSQSANVDIVSTASQSSTAFIESLSSALAKSTP